MKKKDWYFIIILVVCLGVGYFFYSSMQKPKDTVAVYFHDQKIDEIDLTINKTYEYKGDYGVFYLEVKDEAYHAINVECPNHDCEKVGWVKLGSTENIICVPNAIYVSQEADPEGSLK